jgi:hypothetical protein
MKKLAILLALAMAFPLAASKDKDKHKVKDKHYDAVPVGTLAQAAGRYVGVDPEFVVELTATGGGTVRNHGRIAALRNVVIDRGELRATADGEPFRATFLNLQMDGKTTFGLMVHDANVRQDERTVFGDIFCHRQ